ncbi:MAG TPA: CSLREA domain-containing protein, partial [Chthoniobacterales bacterium]
MPFKKLASFIVATAAALRAVAAADVITFDPDGAASANPSIQITGFNFSPGNVLAKNVIPYSVGNVFQFFQQMSVASVRDPAGNPVTPTGLNSAFELTVVSSVTYVITSSSTSGSVATVTAAPAPVQASNSFVEVWYDPSPDANPLTGNGYNDGQRILLANPGSTGDLLFVDQRNANGTPQIGAFDQFGVDNYPGVTTIRASGNASVKASVASRDPAFFSQPLGKIALATSALDVPFTLTNPSNVFASAAGAARSVVANHGSVNGSSGPDFQLQCSGTAGFELTLLTVTNTADHDDGSCSGSDCTLREAIRTANELSGPDVIVFAPNVTGTINLTGALPVISTEVTIIGPGANRLTVRRDTGGNYRIFLISNGSTSGPKVTIRGLTLANGQGVGSGAPGGCIYNDFGTLRIEQCAIVGNGGGIGAGFFNFRGTITVVDSTVSGNVATGAGGAFYNSAAQGPATVNLVNSTLSGNSASRGAAIYNPGTTGVATASLLNCTVTGNAAPLGGISNEGASAKLILQNTLLRTGASGDNIVNANGAVVTSLGNNLSSDAAGGDGGTGPGGLLNQTGDIRNTDPQLDPSGLVDNGGPTQTIALLPGSLAINAGSDAAAPVRDQRGYTRTGVSDIGAFEFAGTIPVTLANLATRLRVETGDNVLIGGFIVTGTQPKKVIVRGIGTSLALPDKLANPTLELHGPNGLIDSNDNWVDSPNKQAIIDSTVAPSSDL